MMTMEIEVLTLWVKNIEIRGKCGTRFVLSVNIIVSSQLHSMFYYLHAVYLLRRCSLPSANSLARWFGEPVRAAIMNSNTFLTNARGFPCLSKRNQNLLTGFFNHSIQIVISGQQMQNLPTETSGSNHNSNNPSEGVDALFRHAATSAKVMPGLHCLFVPEDGSTSRTRTL